MRSKLKSSLIITLLCLSLFFPNTVQAANEPWKSPPIPQGWTYVTGTWDTGYVIKDVNGNEFVWVPVGEVNAPGGVATLKEYDWQKGVTAPSQVTYEPIPPQITNAIATTGGFYVARYEASNNNNKAQSKPNQTPWNSISWTDSKAKAESGSKDWSWTGIYTHLLYDKEWDVIIKWLEKTGADVTNSISWGNYYNDPYTNNNGLMNTGVRFEFCKNNIYDLAGNMWEWTMDMCSNGCRPLRGGIYTVDGASYPASCRYYDGAVTHSMTGFRSAFVVLNSVPFVALAEPIHGTCLSELAEYNRLSIRGNAIDKDNDDLIVSVKAKKGTEVVLTQDKVLNQCGGEGKPFSFSFAIDGSLPEGEYVIDVWANDGK